MAKAKVNAEKCLGCGACCGACPVAIVTMNSEGKATINEEKCVGCGACCGSCPVQAIEIK